jgi:hypothetical protein
MRTARSFPDHYQFIHDWLEIFSGPEHERVDTHAALETALAPLCSLTMLRTGFCHLVSHSALNDSW